MSTEVGTRGHSGGHKIGDPADRGAVTVPAGKGRLWRCAVVRARGALCAASGRARMSGARMWCDDRVEDAAGRAKPICERDARSNDRTSELQE